MARVVIFAHRPLADAHRLSESPSALAAVPMEGDEQSVCASL